MAFPVDIYLMPPNIVVSSTASIYNVGVSGHANFTFGYVEQVNYATANVYAGQRVLYTLDLTERPSITISNKPYFIIDENKIYLIEQPEVLPP